MQKPRKTPISWEHYILLIIPVEDFETVEVQEENYLLLLRSPCMYCRKLSSLSGARFGMTKLHIHCVPTNTQQDDVTKKSKRIEDSHGNIFAAVIIATPRSRSCCCVKIIGILISRSELLTRTQTWDGGTSKRQTKLGCFRNLL